LSYLKNMCIGYQIYFPICNTHTHIYIVSRLVSWLVNVNDLVTFLVS
jgi:hypothetical protein